MVSRPSCLSFAHPQGTFPLTRSPDGTEHPHRVLKHWELSHRIGFRASLENWTVWLPLAHVAAGPWSAELTGGCPSGLPHGRRTSSAIPRSWEWIMKTLGSHGRFWNWDMSVLLERSSWQPVSRTAPGRGTRGWGTSKEAVQIDQAGEAGEAGQAPRTHEGPRCCWSRRKLGHHVNG